MKTRRVSAIAAVSILSLLTVSGGLPMFWASGASSSKIQHLIFVIQENRSFDNFYSGYPGVNGFEQRAPMLPDFPGGGGPR